MLINTKEYISILENIKSQIATVQQRIIFNANAELLMLYWNIGKIINGNAKYGNKFIINLARDIKSDNPNIRGFSERNLYYMAKFAGFYNDLEILQQVAAKLSWRHHQVLLNRVKDYLLELGSGFSFVGQQYHLEISKKDFYIDLLFYHLKLRSYIVIELKNTEFKPEYAGKLNFYVSAVDDILKQQGDNPTIGILLCREKDKIIAEYALKDIDKPISVNEFKLFDKLPKKYAEILPTAEDFESRLKLPEISGKNNSKNNKINKTKKTTDKK